MFRGQKLLPILSTTIVSKIMLILNSMKHETNSIKDKGLVAKLKEDIRVMCCCIVVAVLLTLPQERDSGDTAPSATADTGTPGTLTGLPPHHLHHHRGHYHRHRHQHQCGGVAPARAGPGSRLSETARCWSWNLSRHHQPSPAHWPALVTHLVTRAGPGGRGRGPGGQGAGQPRAGPLVPVLWLLSAGGGGAGD